MDHGRHVILTDFSGIYDHQNKLTDLAEKCISFRSLSGSRGYCSEEAAEQIRKQQSVLPLGGTWFLDNGNTHYMSFFRLEQIREPFHLVMFDHHTDMQPPALLPLLSCGSWLLESLEKLPMLKKVLLIGPPVESWREALETLPEQILQKVLWLPETTCPEEGLGQWNTFLQKGGTEEKSALFISIDKDILSKEELATNWDQGQMTTDRLLQWLDLLLVQHRLFGADICGEPEQEDGAGQSQEINLRLAEIMDQYFPQ